MPANSTGWFWHSLARETQRIGHLYSPGAQRGPWPWFRYALDNGAFAAWEPEPNLWHEDQWSEHAWRCLLVWASLNEAPPLWAIVPDVPGNGAATLDRWKTFAPIVLSFGFPLAIAVQDGIHPLHVERLSPAPDVICVGGSTEWKWSAVETWAKSFKRVHLLRCNAPDKLPWLESIGVESCDGTGWNRRDVKQTRGLEQWARGLMHRTPWPLWPHVCRSERKANRQLAGMPQQEVFA